MRVSKMKNPEKNFKDFHEFINLIANDEEGGIPTMLSDEEVKNIVIESKKNIINIEPESSGLMETSQNC